MIIRIMNRQAGLFFTAFLLIVAVLSDAAFAQSSYIIQAGDQLTVSVWKEPDLTGEVTVSPDGSFSIPLIGTIQASNRTLADVQKDAEKSLSKYIPDPVLSIGLKSSVGSQIYVLGQVNAPGAFTLRRAVDVMQALSLAEGMTSYASANKIRILRRQGGRQIAIKFRYGDVEKGEKLEQNILLQDGDTVVVP